MKPEKNNKKRVVEIYFVLYLAALILLIPDPKEKGAIVDAFASPSESSFSLKPEKSSLTAKLVMDSTGAKILYLDSVNTIFYSGNVTNVKFEFVVEDRTLNQRLSLSSDKPISRHFRIIENSGTKSAAFIWTPPLFERTNKVYLVQVFAEAVKVTNGQAKLYKEKTQFTLIVNFYDKETGKPIGPEAGISQIPGDNRGAGDMFISQSQLGDMILNPIEKRINSYAGQKWRNQINVFGANLQRDLLKAPVLKYTRSPESNGGNAYIKEVTGNSIIIEGDAPGYGSMKVEIKVARKFDGMESSVDFAVIPQPIRQPDFDKVMYPERSYQLQPNMPYIAGQELYACLKSRDGDRVYASGAQGGDFAFTPSISDTGRIIYFERYVNGKMIGQRYPIQISGYPPPEISRIQMFRQNVVRVQTTSFGMHRGKENYVKYLEVLEGNVEYREILGRTTRDAAQQIYTQIFELSPKNHNESLNFKIRAVDERGVRSDIRVYPK